MTTTTTVRTDGATITYDLHGEPGSGVPLLAFGSPMDAGGFGTLAGHFPDRLVVTYDPRGTGRSPKDDPATESRPEQHAADIAAIVEAIGGGPVDAFATSGGAVNGLAWAAAHPGQVRTLVAHEPPLVNLLPDRTGAWSAVQQLGDLYQGKGFGPAMAAFIMLVSHDGELPDDFTFPPVDPAQFGLPTADDGSRTDPLLSQNLYTSTGYDLDVAAVQSVPGRIVLARGEGSGNTLAARGATAAAEATGLELLMFPGDHGGFMNGEYGQPAGKPVEFADRLREVLG